MQVAGYQVMERIGSGGMGEVYKAFHPGLGRTAAVKMLYQKEMTARFENEAYIQASIQHPNIARVYEYCHSGGRPCIIMEYVDGLSLDQQLRAKGRLDNNELARLLLQIVDALKHLHDRGIIHRDIKPQNFKLEPGGQIKMLDFGIAKKKNAPRLTQLGFVIGTTEYMAPEQFRNVHDQRCDIWSLGVMTYELATGYLPFESTEPADLRNRIQRGQFTPPRVLVPQLSPAIESIINGTLRAGPSARLSLEEIRGLLSGQLHRKGIALPSFSAMHKRYIAYGAAGLCGILLVSFLIANSGNEATAELPAVDSVMQHEHFRVKVNVPSVSGASLVLPDGSQQPVPFDFEGHEGRTMEFTIRADGYVDKKVRLTITPRRRTYEYTLDKINQ